MERCVPGLRKTFCCWKLIAFNCFELKTVRSWISIHNHFSNKGFCLNGNLCSSSTSRLHLQMEFFSFFKWRFHFEWLSQFNSFKCHLPIQMQWKAKKAFDGSSNRWRCSNCCNSLLFVKILKFQFVDWIFWSSVEWNRPSIECKIDLQSNTIVTSNSFNSKLFINNEKIVSIFRLNCDNKSFQSINQHQ